MKKDWLDYFYWPKGTFLYDGNIKPVRVVLWRARPGVGSRFRLGHPRRQKKYVKTMGH